MKKKTKKANTKKQPRCPYCGSVAHLRPASEIYGDPSHPGKLYVCSRYPACNSYVATYPGTDVPMGPLANGDLRHLRIRAHRTFDRIWQSQLMTRQQAYRWMADFFGLRLDDAHIGMFGTYRCQALIDKCDEILGNTQ